jgi:uncharacterized protein (TIGR00251 family)
MLNILNNKLAGQGHVIIDVKVTPKSSKDQIVDCFEQLNGRILLKVKIHGAPKKGEVNENLIDFLSDELNLPKSKLQLVGGLTSRRKTLQILA